LKRRVPPKQDSSEKEDCDESNAIVQLQFTSSHAKLVTKPIDIQKRSLTSQHLVEATNRKFPQQNSDSKVNEKWPHTKQKHHETADSMSEKSQSKNVKVAKTHVNVPEKVTNPRLNLQTYCGTYPIATAIKSPEMRVYPNNRSVANVWSLNNAAEQTTTTQLKTWLTHLLPQSIFFAIVSPL